MVGLRHYAMVATHQFELFLCFDRLVCVQMRLKHNVNDSLIGLPAVKSRVFPSSRSFDGLSLDLAEVVETVVSIGRNNQPKQLEKLLA